MLIFFLSQQTTGNRLYPLFEVTTFFNNNWKNVVISIIIYWKKVVILHIKHWKKVVILCLRERL